MDDASLFFNCCAFWAVIFVCMCVAYAYMQRSIQPKKTAVHKENGEILCYIIPVIQAEGIETFEVVGHSRIAKSPRFLTTESAEKYALSN